MFKSGDEILDKRFQVLNKIGSGAFGEIYTVQKKLTKETYAMKVERPAKNTKQIMVFWESKLMKTLKNKTSVPNIYFVG